MFDQLRQAAKQLQLMQRLMQDEHIQALLRDPDVAARMTKINPQALRG